MPQETYHDPRETLARQKYFTLRPRPLEQWLWKQGIAPSAERVFWLHWQEGLRNRSWCSEIALKRVAALCALDVSSVTRAYQALAKLGLVRRQDPGRDPSRPFEQAVVITEVRVPRELVQELDRHPNRMSSGIVSIAPVTSPVAADTGKPQSGSPRDPFKGLSGRQRIRALGALVEKFSAGERRQYDEAMRTHQARFAFDPDTKLSTEERGRVLQLLEVITPLPLPATTTAVVCAQKSSISGPRKLTVFELARLRRDLHRSAGIERSEALMREIVWSVEEGALKRFPTLHAMRIALKKIREGTWTRPNRMPPQWLRSLAGNETCSNA